MFDGGRNGTPNGISGKVQDPVKITLVPLVLHTKDISILGKFYRVYVEKTLGLVGYCQIGFLFQLYHMFGKLFIY